MVNVAYICGAGHSGSTLLDVLLSRHPEVEGLGEVHRISIPPFDRLCGCGSSIQKCTYWTPIIKDYLNHFENRKPSKHWQEIYPITIAKKKGMLGFFTIDFLALVGSQKLLYGFSKIDPFTRNYLNAIKNSWKFYEAIHRQTTAKLVIDSTKNPLRGKITFLERPSSVRFIKLVRDGRAVAASAIRREGVEMRKAAKSWLLANRKVDLALATVPKRLVKLVRYEDLCDDPLNQVHEIWAWLGIDQSKSRLTELIQEHQIPGNPMIFKGVDKIKKDENWKFLLTEEQIRTFKKVAGEYNLSLGYF